VAGARKPRGAVTRGQSCRRRTMLPRAPVVPLAVEEAATCVSARAPWGEARVPTRAPPPWPWGGPRRRASSWAPGARRSGAPWGLGLTTHVGASGARARHKSSSWQPAQHIPALGGTPRWSCSSHSEVPPRHSHPWHTSREKTKGVSDW
jgi:hypothetical protein